MELFKKTKILSPSQNDWWAVGKKHVVSWLPVAGIDPKTKISISIDGGPSGRPTIVADNISYGSSSYEIIVPNILGKGDEEEGAAILIDNQSIKHRDLLSGGTIHSQRFLVGLTGAISWHYSGDLSDDMIQMVIDWRIDSQIADKKGYLYLIEQDYKQEGYSLVLTGEPVYKLISPVDFQSKTYQYAVALSTFKEGKRYIFALGYNLDSSNPDIIVRSSYYGFDINDLIPDRKFILMKNMGLR